MISLCPTHTPPSPTAHNTPDGERTRLSFCRSLSSKYEAYLPLGTRSLIFAQTHLHEAQDGMTVPRVGSRAQIRENRRRFFQQPSCFVKLPAEEKRLAQVTLDALDANPISNILVDRDALTKQAFGLLKLSFFASNTA